jgi:hypothetical protein
MSEQGKRNRPPRFDFSTFAFMLKGATSGDISDSQWITMLYGFIGDALKLENRDGFRIECSKSQASQIKHRKGNAHETIRKHCDDPRLGDSVTVGFRKMVVPSLMPSETDELVSLLLQSIAASDLTDNIKDELRSLSEQDDISAFLARCLQISLKIDIEPEDIDEAIESVSKRQGRQKTEVPEAIAQEEMPYVDALMKVYAEEFDVEALEPDELEGLSEREKRHFDDQRRHYYSAEYVRHSMRDAYSESAEDQFGVLEDEVYDGVEDVYQDDYATSKKRLTSVLAQAASIPVNKCWISRETDWIGNSEKKGICHILVNDRRIRGWLDDDR